MGLQDIFMTIYLCRVSMQKKQLQHLTNLLANKHMHLANARPLIAHCYAAHRSFNLATLSFWVSLIGKLS